MPKKLLLLDCDGVIFNSNELIDEYVRKIDFCASDKYCKLLIEISTRLESEKKKLKMERPSESELINKKDREIKACEELIEDHYYRKDKVLEEVSKEYQNRIDYFKIYQEENTFPGVVGKINEIAEMGLYDDVYIVSHYNSENEKKAKEMFFEKHFPNVKVMLIKFHKEMYSPLKEDVEKNKARKRTNKILEFTSQTGINDFSMTSFIDDSLSIIEEAEHLGVKHCLFKDKMKETSSLLDQIVEYAIYEVDDYKENGMRGK